MARINLLPWRENLRRQRQREFGLMLVGGLVVSLLIVGWWHFFNEGLMDHQKRRNAFLEREIAVVDKQIKEIQAIERTRSQLIARMNVIQDLQVSRPQIVHLFDELVETIPAGAFLTQTVQNGGAVALTGRAQSNARVSAYMRNVERSPWLADPQLKIIENKEQSKEAAEMSDFRLTIKQRVPKSDLAEAGQ
jgi:type IV pilus assembly protein PilN